MPSEQSDKPIRSMREFCERFFPTSHAEKTCHCYPEKKRGVLVILSRPGVNPQPRGRRC